jgi:hypothetical protein
MSVTTRDGGRDRPGRRDPDLPTSGVDRPRSAVDRQDPAHGPRWPVSPKG